MLQLSKVLYEEMVAHCQREYPKEACGILAGNDHVVNDLYPMTNVDQSPISYQMDPTEQLRIMKQMRVRTQEMLAIYHSHPRGPAAPSAQDIARAFYPDAAHIIVSLASLENPVVRGFRIVDGRATEIELHAIV